MKGHTQFNWIWLTPTDPWAERLPIRADYITHLGQDPLCTPVYIAYRDEPLLVKESISDITDTLVSFHDHTFREVAPDAARPTSEQATT